MLEAIEKELKHLDSIKIKINQEGFKEITENHHIKIAKNNYVRTAEKSHIKIVDKKHKNVIDESSKEVVKSMNEEKLRCAVNKGNYQYYINKKYVRLKDLDKVIYLVKRDYYSKLMSKVSLIEEKLLELKELYNKNTIENVYNNLVIARRRLIEPIEKSVDSIIADFNNIKYEGKSFDEDDDTEYYTIKGERVRSKSEKIIADELYRYGVPYKYEYPIELDGKRGKVYIYSDFTVLNRRTGKKYILEHFGMMDSQEYYEKVMFKLDTYEKNNILLGEGLIILHETLTQPLNTKVLDKYIEKYFC